MITLDAATLRALLDYPSLTERLWTDFARDVTTPVRPHYEIETPSPATLLLMPAWTAGDSMGIKIATVFPGNAAAGLPTVQGSYILMSASDGSPVAIMDGTALTLLRTAAMAALAARTLARADAAHLLVIGTGALAADLVRAHYALQPWEIITLWGRDPAKARTLAASLSDEIGATIRPTGDLEAAVRRADVITSATTSREPIVCGAWLTPGTHLSLMGGFKPDMRECDDDAIARATLFADDATAACTEAGDFTQPIARGLITSADIAGDFETLARGRTIGRTNPGEITILKSVGTARADLAAAVLAIEHWQHANA